MNDPKTNKKYFGEETTTKTRKKHATKTTRKRMKLAKTSKDETLVNISIPIWMGYAVGQFVGRLSELGQIQE